ncbi:DUF2723 domain-containing protein [Candidatus Sumerlaeota bacterium]|nr:DUF2723 domain-containing protein [Candidatus Sumerlaeota bacterium]
MMLSPSGNAFQRWERERWLGALLAGLVFLLYWLTMAPGVMTDDSAEFQHLCRTLGKTHPPGYALLLLAGRAFAALPLGAQAWRMTLLSVASGAAGVWLLYRLLIRLGLRGWIAFFSAAAFAVSHTFWMQCVMPEAYALNVVFLGALAHMALGVREGGPMARRWLWAGALTSALAAGNHQTQVFLTPALLLWGVCYARAGGLNGKDFAAAAAFYLLGLTVFLVLPLRFAAIPGAIAEGRTPWTEALNLISGGPSRGLFIGFDWPRLVKRVATYIGYHGLQVPGLAGLVILIGFAVALKRDRALLALLIYIWGVTVGYATFFDSSDVYVFYIPAYWVGAVLLAYGLSGADGWQTQRRWSPMCKSALSITTLLSLIIIPPATYFYLPGWIERHGSERLRNLSQDKGNVYYLQPWKLRYTFAEDAMRHWLRAARPGEAIITDWNFYHTALYLQRIERFCTDARTVNVEYPSMGGIEDWRRYLSLRLDGYWPEEFLITSIEPPLAQHCFVECFGAGYRVNTTQHPLRRALRHPIELDLARLPQHRDFSGGALPYWTQYEKYLFWDRFDFRNGVMPDAPDEPAWEWMRGSRLCFRFRNIATDDFHPRAYCLELNRIGAAKRLSFNRAFHRERGMEPYFITFAPEHHGGELDADTWIGGYWPPGRYALYLRLSESDGFSPDNTNRVWRLGQVVLH